MGYDKRLRLVQIVLHSLCLIASLGTSLSLGWSVRVYYNYCPLYTQVQLEWATNHTLRVGPGTVWQAVTLCNFAIYTAACGAILAIMWFWFYLLLSNFKTHHHQGNEVPPDARLLMPSMMVNVPLLVLALIVACIISDGHAAFCAGVRKTPRLDCGLVGRQAWSLPPEGEQGYQYLQLSLVFSWFWFLSLLVTVALVGARIQRFLRQGAQYGAYSITSFRSSYQHMSSDDYSSSDDAEDDVMGDPVCENLVHGFTYDGKMLMDPLVEEEGTKAGWKDLREST